MLIKARIVVSEDRKLQSLDWIEQGAPNAFKSLTHLEVSLFADSAPRTTQRIPVSAGDFERHVQKYLETFMIRLPSRRW